MTTSTQTTLKYFPPMGVYETLFRFMDSCHKYMGEPGTHPWAQGFPLTTRLPGGPELPGSVSFGSQDLKYPPATGIPQLLTAITRYYNHFYDAGITEDNVAVFAGGRPGIFATVAFLTNDYEVLIEETEYTPYYDLLELLERPYRIIPSNPSNQFRPGMIDYRQVTGPPGGEFRKFFIKSNPCNPTGVTWSGETLDEFVHWLTENDHGALIDEAYEFFNALGADSALRYIENIDDTNLFVSGAATKGLQVPGMRVGWVIASRRNVEIFRNYSSIGMGGVSRPSQLYVTDLLETARVTRAREAVRQYFNEQREFYREGLTRLGVRLCSGQGGFYHWGLLPGELNADQFNERLFSHKAAILPGRLCDMHRAGEDGELNRYFRFSFGPLSPESRENDLEILASCLAD
jgi:aspartate/methionine/tyrosine aminotransferase